MRFDFRRLNQGQWDLAGLLAIVLLAFSFVFGGGSRQHAVPLGLVELAAVPLLCLVGHRLAVTGEWARRKSVLALIGAMVALPLIQLIPLPPELWTRLPGREDMVLALTVLETPAGWSPLSLTPDATRGAALALLPPLAMFLAVVQAPTAQREGLAALYVVVAVIAVAVGVVQMIVGEGFHPYSTTQAGSMTGLFANRNHLATLVLMTLPLAAALAAGAESRQGRSWWMFGLYALMAVIAIGLIRSRMGVILAGPVLLTSVLIAWKGGETQRLGLRLIGLMAGAAAAVALVAGLGLAPILDRFDGAGTDARFDYWPTVIETASRFQPVGAGMGSFDPVYRSVEPLEELTDTFLNQAHNDYLEIWLEGGVPAVLILIGLSVWIVRAGLKALRQGRSRRDWPLAPAALVAILAVAAHSGFDYPLRTPTLAVLFAFCLASLTSPPGRRSRGGMTAD